LPVVLEQGRLKTNFALGKGCYLFSARPVQLMYWGMVSFSSGKHSLEDQLTLLQPIKNTLGRESAFYAILQLPSFTTTSHDNIKFPRPDTFLIAAIAIVRLPSFTLFSSL